MKASTELSSVLLAGRLSALTSYFSFQYLLIFLPACVLAYALSPKWVKKYVLLLFSTAFFWLISGKLVAYLLGSAVSMYGFGLWLQEVHRQRDEALARAEKGTKKAIRARFLRRSRGVLALAVTLHVGLLLTLKYAPFLGANFNSLLELLHIPVRVTVPKYLIPIGISFFTLQAVSYLFDVYRGTVPADRNPLRLGLFLAFFPQIVEGPICRYGQTAHQLWNAEQIRYDNLARGTERILFGLMKKLVIANRLNPLIQTIFSDYSQYQGGIIFLGAVCYTIQLYMDFSGTMDLVMGTGEIFGVTLPENFRRPFFSKSISEFWQRWHITLGTWFKDYVFYPISMSGPMKRLTVSAKKRLGTHAAALVAGGVALLCVWVCNGLWHGSAWSYLFFGMYHFALIFLGSVTAPLSQSLRQKLHIAPECGWFRAVQIVRTGLLVVVGELFFRAHGLRAGLGMFRSMVTDFRFSSMGDRLLGQLGVDIFDLLIVVVALIGVFVISSYQERGVRIRESLHKKPLPLRWALLYGLILFIVIFGAYGPGYVPVDPIYANF